MEYTACKDCKHFRNLAIGRKGKDIWYNHICMAVPPAKHFNSYFGKMEEEPKYCRDINTEGKCKDFIKR